MVKKNKIKIILAVFLLIVSPIIFSCDTASKNHPVVFINVNISQTVDQVNKLYVVFHMLPDWNSAWLTLGYDAKTIIIPPLDIGKIPLYFEIIYDVSGTGTPSTVGNWYQGWYRKTIRTGLGAQIMDAFIIPDVPIMLLDVDMDTHGTF